MTIIYAQNKNNKQEANPKKQNNNNKPILPPQYEREQKDGSHSCINTSLVKLETLTFSQRKIQCNTKSYFSSLCNSDLFKPNAVVCTYNGKDLTYSFDETYFTDQEWPNQKVTQNEDDEVDIEEDSQQITDNDKNNQQKTQSSTLTNKHAYIQPYFRRKGEMLDEIVANWNCFSNHPSYLANPELRCHSSTDICRDMAIKQCWIVYDPASSFAIITSWTIVLILAVTLSVVFCFVIELKNLRQKYNAHYYDSNEEGLNYSEQQNIANKSQNRMDHNNEQSIQNSHMQKRIPKNQFYENSLYNPINLDELKNQ